MKNFIHWKQMQEINMPFQFKRKNPHKLLKIHSHFLILIGQLTLYTYGSPPHGCWEAF